MNVLGILDDYCHNFFTIEKQLALNFLDATCRPLQPYHLKDDEDFPPSACQSLDVSMHLNLQKTTWETNSIRHLNMNWYLQLPLSLFFDERLPEIISNATLVNSDRK